MLLPMQPHYRPSLNFDNYASRRGRPGKSYHACDIRKTEGRHIGGGILSPRTEFRVSTIEL